MWYAGTLFTDRQHSATSRNVCDHKLGGHANKEASYHFLYYLCNLSPSRDWSMVDRFREIHLSHHNRQSGRRVGSLQWLRVFKKTLESVATYLVFHTRDDRPNLFKSLMKIEKYQKLYIQVQFRIQLQNDSKSDQSHQIQIHAHLCRKQQILDKAQNYLPKNSRCIVTVNSGTRQNFRQSVDSLENKHCFVAECASSVTHESQSMPSGGKHKATLYWDSLEVRDTLSIMTE